jgi:hypothetical protein
MGHNYPLRGRETPTMSRAAALKSKPGWDRRAAAPQPIEINGSDPNHYVPMKKAA